MFLSWLSARKVQLLNVLAVLALFVALGSWALASPPGSDPDGNFHLASIYCGGGFRDGYCEPPSQESADKDPKVVKVPAAVATANACVPGNPIYAASCYPEALKNLEMTETRYNNAGRLYPNGYYWVANKFVVKNDVTRTVLNIRILNIVLFIVLLAGIHQVGSRGVRRATYVSSLVILLPLGHFLIASNNGSSWTVIGIGLYWAYLMTFLMAEKRWHVVVAGSGAAVAAAMAMQSRADGALYIIFTSIITIGVVFSRCQQVLRKNYLRVVLPVVLGPAAYVSYSATGQKRAVTQGLLGPEDTGRDSFETFLFNVVRIPGHVQGIFGGGRYGGGLGWLDVTMPEVVTLTMTCIAAGMLFVYTSRRGRIETTLLSVFALMLFAIPLAAFQMDTLYVGENVQSRYVFPLVTAFVGLFLSSETTPQSWRPSRYVRVLVVLALTVAFMVAMQTTMRRYITGDDIIGWNLNSPKEWWWTNGPEPMTVLYVGTGAFAYVSWYVMRSLGESPDQQLSKDVVR